MADKVKPCDEPCPKCGNADISLRYAAAGSSHVYGLVGTADTLENETEYSVKKHYDVRKYKKDTINHYCRKCQYQWEGAPLDAPQETESASVG